MEPLDDQLGINFRSNGDDTLKDNGPDGDLPRSTRTSLRVILNGGGSRFYRKAERLGPGFGGMHGNLCQRTIRISCRGRCNGVVSRDTRMRPRSASSAGYPAIIPRALIRTTASPVTTSRRREA